MPDVAESSSMDPRIKAILRYMIGGGLIGVGIGGVSSLTDYLKKLNRDKRADDDDTLYVYREGVKSASPNAYSDPVGSIGEAAGHAVIDIGSGTVNLLSKVLGSAANGVSEAAKDPASAGVASVGALLSALGGYALVKKLYSEYDKNKAQEELDKAQMAFLDAQGYKKAGVKQAALDENGNFSGGDLATGIATVGLPLLTLLASAVGVNKFLQMQYPVKKKLPKEPRRIEIIDKPDTDVQEYDEPMESYNKTAAAREFVLHMIDATGSPDSDIRNLISATANDGTIEFNKAASAMGFVNALEMVKGASERSTDPKARHIAISYLAKSARYGDTIGIIAAGEFAETYPGLYKTASSLDAEQQDALFGIAAELGSAIRTEGAFECGLLNDTLAKEASQVSSAMDPQDAMEQWLNQNTRSNLKPATKGDSDESTGTSGEEAGIEDPNSPSRPQSPHQYVMTGKTGRNHIDSNRVDAIDEFLSPTPQKKDQDQPAEGSGV